MSKAAFLTTLPAPVLRSPLHAFGLAASAATAGEHNTDDAVSPLYPGMAWAVGKNTVFVAPQYERQRETGVNT